MDLIVTHDTPTGAAESCPLEFEGGDVGTLKLKPKAEAVRPRSEADMGRKPMTLNIFDEYLLLLKDHYDNQLPTFYFIYPITPLSGGVYPINPDIIPLMIDLRFSKCFSQR